MADVAELGARLKAKYPGSYDHLSDMDAGARLQAKYPGAYDNTPKLPPMDPQAAAPPAAAPPVQATPTNSQQPAPAAPLQSAAPVPSPTQSQPPPDGNTAGMDTRDLQLTGPPIDPANPGGGNLPSAEQAQQLAAAGAKMRVDAMLTPQGTRGGVEPPGVPNPPNPMLSDTNDLGAPHGKMADGLSAADFGAAPGHQGPTVPVGEMHQALSAWGSQTFPKLAPEASFADHAMNAVGRVLTNFVSPDSLTEITAISGAAAALPALANLPGVAAKLKNLPALLKALDVTSRIGPDIGIGAVTGKAIYDKGKPKDVEDAIETGVNVLMGGASIFHAVSAGRAVLAQHPAGAELPAKAMPGSPEAEAGVPVPPSPKAIAEAPGKVAGLKAGGSNLAAQSWQNIAEYGKKPIEVPLGDGTTGTIVSRPRNGKTRGDFAVVDKDGKVRVAGDGETVRGWVQQRTHKTTSGEAGGSAEVGEGVVEAGELAQDTKPAIVQQAADTGKPYRRPQGKKGSATASPDAGESAGEAPSAPGKGVNGEAPAKPTLPTAEDLVAHNADGSQLPAGTTPDEKRAGAELALEQTHAESGSQGGPAEGGKGSGQKDEGTDSGAPGGAQTDTERIAVPAGAAKGNTDSAGHPVRPGDTGSDTDVAGSAAVSPRSPRTDTLVQGAEFPEGTERVNHLGGVERLERVPLDKIDADPTNTMYPDKVAEYVANPGTVKPELRKNGGDRYSTYDGHHRIAAARERGDTDTLAWVSKSNATGYAQTDAEKAADETAPAGTPEQRFTARVRKSIDSDEDLRLSLEKVAEKEFGGTRAGGAFDKQKIYELQETAMNQWLADNGPRHYQMPFDEAVKEIRGKMSRLATQTVRSDEKIRKQQFSTPPQIAHLAGRALAAGKQDTILEPSAGTGGLVAGLRDQVGKININEIDPERSALAGEVGFKGATHHDAEVIHALLDPKIKPTRIIMNPPFSSSALKNNGQSTAKGKSKYGYNHLKSAMQRLEPGGRAVIIMGGGTENHPDQGASLTAPSTTAMWQDLAKQYHIRANVRIGGKEYAKNGTTFGTRVIVIDKTGPTPGANWLEQLATIERGDYGTVEEAHQRLSVLASPSDAAPGRDDVKPGDAKGDGEKVGNPGVDGDNGSVQPGAPGRRGSGEENHDGEGDSTGGRPTRPQPPAIHPGAPPQRDSSEQPGTQPAGRPQAAAPGSSASAPQRPNHVKPTREDILAEAKRRLKPAADAARKRLLDKMSGRVSGSGIDPQDLLDLGTIGADMVLDGAITFKKWIKAASDALGDLITRYTEADQRLIHEKAQEMAEDSMAGAEGALAGSPLGEQPPAEEPPTETPDQVKSPELKIEKVAPPAADAEDDSAGAFATYHPGVKGKAHNADIVESKSMATVALPAMTYKPMLPADIDISAVQMESVILAGQQNERINPDGTRAAALIGDGTGVGKGRTIAAIILDNWNHGRRRILWVSKSWTLQKAAMEDLEAVGAPELAKAMRPLSKFHKGGKAIAFEGVIFATYDLVKSQDTHGTQVMPLVSAWLQGDDNSEKAYIAWDESHAMKNTVPAQRVKPSITGTRTHKLRQENPGVRQVFLSATAATEVTNLGYLERLGLWGPQTPFPRGFSQFVSEIAEGGIAAMELIARELKSHGKYIARTLSYRGVTHRIAVHALNPDQKALYREAAKAWRDVTVQVQAAVQTINGGRQARSNFMTQFWNGHQRFFNLLITALKIPTAIEEAEKALKEGHSPVITLVNTSEATQNRQEAKTRADPSGEDDGEDDDDLDFGPKEILTSLIQDHFPVQQWVDDVDDQGRPIKTPLYEADGVTAVRNPAAEAQRDALIAHLNETLRVPENPLDILINHFGRANVAEMTGRKKYYDAATGLFVKRGGGLKEKDVNLDEMRAFQAGEKLIAVLSGAAGTGISLQSDLKVANQRPRVHITLQAGWSADKVMQMLGRTHRTNQAHPPEYVSIASDLSGEKRFLGVIAKRLGLLGALTRGSTDASGAEGMDKTDYFGTQGIAAATTFGRRLFANGAIPGVDLTGPQVLDQMGMIRTRSDGTQVLDAGTNVVSRLLNRVLALDPDLQNKVFDYFADIFGAEVEQAIERGELDTGVKELASEAQGDRTKILSTKQIAADPETGAKTYHYQADTETKYNLADPAFLDKQMMKHPDGEFYVNKKTSEIMFGIEAEPVTHANGSTTEAIRVIRPRSKDWSKITKPDGHGQWTVSAETPAASRAQWDSEHDAHPKSFTTHYHLIGGAVLKHWNTVKPFMRSRDGGIRLARDSKTGERIVGVVIPQADIAGVVAQIGGGTVQVTPEQIVSDVLANGTEYALQGIRVKRFHVARNPVVQLIPADQATGRVLIDRFHVAFEKGIAPVYYIPTLTTVGQDRLSATQILTRIMRDFPLAVRRLAGDQSGAVSLNAALLGLPKFWQKDIAPSLAKAAAGIVSTYDDILRTFAPGARGPQAAGTHQELRYTAAELERRMDMAWTKLEDAGKELMKLPAAVRFDFIDRIETGQRQTTPALQKIADVIRVMLDSARDQVQALGTGKLEAFYEHYFPHIWKDPKKAGGIFAGILSKRPFEGRKSFLKQRTIITIADGMAAGLEPMSENPVELVLAKLGEMQKYIMARHALANEKLAGRAKFGRGLNKPKNVAGDWRVIDDAIATVYGPRLANGSATIRGRYWAPEASALLFNNYLSPGLRAKSAAFRGYMAAGNVLLQFQLGWSAFHGTFVSLSGSMTGRAALGIYQANHGAKLAGLKSFAMGLTPVTPFQDYRAGKLIQKAWSRPGSQTPYIEQMADAVAEAGGRAKFEKVYQTQMAARMMDAFRQGNLLGGLVRSPFAATEQVARPIMEFLVPRMKLGAYAKMAEFEIERLGPGATPAELRKALGTAWDSIDNRFGQLVYDNTGWNRTLKDLMQGAFRTVGWNTGDIREIGGGGFDAGKGVNDLAHGRRFEISHKLSYLIAMGIVAGLYGGITHWLMTGEHPKELLDYYYPGDGEGGRMALPSYIKEIVSVGHDPAGWAKGKLHPLLTLFADMITNRDYFNRPIAKPGDPLEDQVAALAKYPWHVAEPISLQGWTRNQDQSIRKQILPFIGLPNAPKYIGDDEGAPNIESLLGKPNTKGTAGGDIQRLLGARAGRNSDLDRLLKKGATR